MNVHIRNEEDLEVSEESHAPENVQYHHADYDEALAEAGDDGVRKPFVRTAEKPGRNDPCACGSGKKYKQCHGKLN